MIGLEPYLGVAAALFALGLYGLLTKRNAVALLMSVELMLNAANLNLIAFSRFTAAAAADGQIFVLFTIAVAAAEVAVGLALVFVVYRRRRTVNVSELNRLKW